LTELYDYVSKHPTADDNASVTLTLRYLEACKKLFEEGFLSHKRVSSCDSSVLASIRTGFNHFANWHKDLSAKGNLY